MPAQWQDLPLNKPLFANLDEEAVTGALAAIENGFVNELGGHTRFPGMIERVSLPDNGRVYLHDLAGDLIASTSKGRIYRIDRRYQATDVTGVPVSGGRRTIFAKTDKELLMAAGGPIVRLRDVQSELLSPNAPLATHVQWLDNFTIANELNTGRFRHSPPGQPDVWEDLDSFSADGNPDNINSLIVTPFRELIVGGENSVEQFERVTTGDTPFFRRWAVGDGVKLPYMECFADNALFTINKLTELVRFSGQTSEARSAEIGKLLEKITDWSDAWMGGFPDYPLHIVGQKFIVFQAPNAINSYGTKGITILYDYRAKRFSLLYGWDARRGVPGRWPAWSHHRIWDRVYIGGEGKIYELTPDSYRNGTELQRWLIRTALIGDGTGLQMRGFRLQLKRGLGDNGDSPPMIRVRCSRDGRPFGNWVTKSLGRSGETNPLIEFGSFGNAATFQFEISSGDDCAIDLVKAQALVVPIGH
jgi:hypothetical protein